MYAYRVDRETLEATLDGLGTVGRQIDEGSIESMDKALEGVYDIAQRYIPRGKGPNSGALAESMDKYISDLRPGFGSITGKVTMKNREGGQLPYAWMREVGGVIRPKISNPIGRLVWTDEQTNELIFARRVTQAGSHYMEGAAIEGKDVFLESFQVMVEDVISLGRS